MNRPTAPAAPGGAGQPTWLGAGLRLAAALAGAAAQAWRPNAPADAWARAAAALDGAVGETPAGWFDAGLSHAALRALAEAAETARVLAGEPAAALDCTELADKVVAFDLFRHAEALVDERLDPDDRHRADLEARLAGAARAWPAEQALWLAEGLGYAWAARRPVAPEADGPHAAGPRAGDSSSGGAHLAGRLRERRLAGWRLPLHTGAGLAWARHTLAAGDPATAWGRFSALVGARAEVAYAGAVTEALGMAARLAGHDLADLDDLWWPGAPVAAARARFWHGAGRGLYFTGEGLLVGPTAAWRALETARLEAPDRLARRNLVAGQAWAVTLVNLAQPRVLERVLLDVAGGLAHDEARAAAAGIAGALDLWRWTIGADSLLAAVAAHAPARPSGRRGRWDELVGAPARQRLDAPARLPDFMASEPPA